MTNIGEADIQSFDKDAYDYTCITFEPDFKRFSMKGLDSDILGLMYKRVYDIGKSCVFREI